MQVAIINYLYSGGLAVLKCLYSFATIMKPIQSYSLWISPRNWKVQIILRWQVWLQHGSFAKMFSLKWALKNKN